MESSAFNVYCHVIGIDGHLYVNFSDDSGATWQWADRGTPPGVKLAIGEWGVNATNSLSNFDISRQLLFTFAIGEDKNLYAHHGDGKTWSWKNLGQPAGSRGVGIDSNNSFAFTPTSVTYLMSASSGAGAEKVFAPIWIFIKSANGPLDPLLNTHVELYACYNPDPDISPWQWIDLGPYPGGEPADHYPLYGDQCPLLLRK